MGVAESGTFQRFELISCPEVGRFKAVLVLILLFFRIVLEVFIRTVRLTRTKYVE